MTAHANEFLPLVGDDALGKIKAALPGKASAKPAATRKVLVKIAICQGEFSDPIPDDLAWAVPRDVPAPFRGNHGCFRLLGYVLGFRTPSEGEDRIVLTQQKSVSDLVQGPFFNELELDLQRFLERNPAQVADLEVRAHQCLLVAPSGGGHGCHGDYPGLKM